MYKITVIVSIYNIGDTLLQECLNSIIKQSIGIQNIQVICINDASDFAETEIPIQKQLETQYPHNFFIIYNEYNLGLGYSRNKGIPYIKGEYTHFLDADDYIDRNLYLEAYQQLKKNSAQLFRINFYRLEGSKNKHYAGNSSYEGLMDGKDKTRALFYSYAWKNIVDTELVKQQKPFVEGIYEDMRSTPSLFYSDVYRYYQTNKPYYYYRINPTSITQKALHNKWARDELKTNYLLNVLDECISMDYFSIDHGQAITHFFLVYMFSCTKDNYHNFINVLLRLYQWKSYAKSDSIDFRLHPDSVKDFGIFLNIANQFLLMLWKARFFELLFLIKKIINLLRSIQNPQR